MSILKASPAGVVPRQSLAQREWRFAILILGYHFGDCIKSVYTILTVSQNKGVRNWDMITV